MKFDYTIRHAGEAQNFPSSFWSFSQLTSVWHANEPNRCRDYKTRRREHKHSKRKGEKMKAKLTFNFYLNILPHRRRLLHSSTSSLSLLSCLHPSVFVFLMSCRLLTFPTFSSLSASSSKSNYTSSFVFLGFLRAPSILDLCFFKTRPTLTKLERNFNALIQLM